MHKNWMIHQWFKMRIKLILALVLFAVVTADDQIEPSSKALLVCRTFYPLEYFLSVYRRRTFWMWDVFASDNFVFSGWKLMKKEGPFKNSGLDKIAEIDNKWWNKPYMGCQLDLTLLCSTHGPLITDRDSSWSVCIPFV